MPLKKLTLTAYKDPEFTAQVGEPFTVLVNPEKYGHAYKIEYDKRQPAGSNGGSPKFRQIGAETVAFELIFDGSGVIPGGAGERSFDGAGLPARIEAFKELIYTYNGNIHEPNYLKLSWGKLVFLCRMTRLSFSYTLFQPDGTPIRARANAEFLSYADEVLLAKQAKRSSPDLSHVHIVRAGDTLPLMCHRIYGSSVHYAEVARVNGLAGFRDLPVGRPILFPPLEKRPA